MIKDGFKKNTKKGWTLVELCIALIALTILVGISIQSIKPRKLLYAPFAYAGVQNLRQANFYIFNKCKNGQVVGCDTTGSELPVMSDEVLTNYVKWYCDNNPDSLSEDVLQDYCDNNHSQGEAYDPYCYEVAEVFTLIDGDVNCKMSANTKLPTGNGKGANAGKANFQAANMVSYYFLESTWRTINKATPVETDMLAVTPTKYKEIFIDLNGDKEPNRLGEDQFPLRLYVTGEVIPSICAYYNKEKEGVDVDDVNYDGSTVAFMCPGTIPAGGIRTWVTETFPFAYDLYRSYVPDPSNAEARKTERILSGVSFKEASCRAGRDNMIPREDLCGDDGTTFSTSLTDKTFKVYEQCTSEYKPNDVDNAQSSFCIVRLARPSNPGLFRLPIAL